MLQTEQQLLDSPLLGIDLINQPITESKYAHPRRLGAFAVAGALALMGMLGEITSDHISYAFASHKQEMQIAKAAQVQAPQALADQAENILQGSVNAWSQKQTLDGSFIDPVSGPTGGYGVGMLGQAMVETGSDTNQVNLVSQGIKAELYEIAHPNLGGFELFSLAGAYAWNQSHISNNPDWQSAQPKIANFLASHKEFKVGSGGLLCYANPRCYNNLKLVRAFADIELLASGLSTQTNAASVGHNSKLSNEVNTLISQAASNTGADAKIISKEGVDQAGILSDPSRDPLAYHDLSAMILGHVVETLGKEAPSMVRSAFERSTKAIVGLMAPDGDTAYIGRGQGQVWNVAASADALSIAAANTQDPVWRSRYIASAARAIARLKVLYPVAEWGMPLVPRLTNATNPDYLGIDHYANSVEYNGLALWALKDAIQQLRSTAPANVSRQNLNTIFVDPSHTKFVAIKKDNYWLAIHAADTSTDARYDFGLVAAEKKVNGVWLPSLPYRPLTTEKTSAGPLLLAGGQKLVPIGTKIAAKPNGSIVVQGGWAQAPNAKPTTDLKTIWKFKPVNNGLSMEFKPLKDRKYKFQIWYQTGSKLLVNNKQVKVNEPNGRSETYSFNVPLKVAELSEVYHSAYDANLSSSAIDVTGVKGKSLKYSVQF